MAEGPTTPDDHGSESPRIPLTVAYPTVEAFIQDYEVNISRGGTMIRIGRAIAVNDVVELCLSFPGLLVPLCLFGVVRWVQEESPAELSAGLAFEGEQPIEWDALAELVRRIQENDVEVMAPVVHVVLVEDNIHVAKLLSDGIEGYRKRSDKPIAFVVKHAMNGKDALDLLGAEPCELLLVDMYLPVLDGETLIREVRSDARWKHLPVVALSAGGTEARDGAFAAGADFFLDKPVRLNDLLAVLRKTIEPGFRHTEVKPDAG